MLCPKNPDERRLVVITFYNPQSYQIDDIDWNLSPKTYKFEFEYRDKETKEQIKMKDNLIKYLNIKYNLIIHPDLEN